jgi:hypothetical protein
MHTLRFRYLTLFALLGVILSACNMPRGTPATTAVNAINTGAAETVAARLTQAAQPPPTGAVTTPIPTQSTANTPAAPTSQPAGEASPTAAATQAGLCDRVRFIQDVTYPDDTEVAAGQTFVKTWRLENAGTCTWTTAYALVYSGGDRMEAPDSSPLPNDVAPGERIDLSVTLKAPAEAGTYRSDFTLRNASGTTFGSQGDSFYVQVVVPGPAGSASGGFDFVSQAASASWASGTGNTLDTSLAFGGADDDANGTATIKDGVKLETGAISGKVLLTVPKRVDDGTIGGTYPQYTVGNGEHLKARLAFLTNSDGNCGTGNVIYQIAYKEGDSIKILNEWTQTCDGNAEPIDIDLSSLRGKTVQFMLIVRANGSSQDDWAVWNSPRIE